MNLNTIAFLPTQTESGIVLAEMWINPQENMLYKLIDYTKETGSYEVLFEYADQPYDLPDKFIIKFQLDKNNIPKCMKGSSGAFDAEEKKR